MNSNFEYMSNLQYKVKVLDSRLQAFESGEKYKSMKSAFKAQLSHKDREIRNIKVELANARSQLVTMRHEWLKVFDDLEKEHAKELEKKDRKIKEMEERALRAERQRDDSKANLKEKTLELYSVKTELEDERGKNLMLKAQISRDHENSSKPSSLTPDRKKITNNRETSGKRPGGQAGHSGHTRKKHAPTNRIEIPVPEKYEDGQKYRLTGRIISKQKVDIRVEVVVDEYFTPEFRNTLTGQRVHAAFPEGLVNDVTYGGNIKAFAFLLNNRCNVSIAKVSDFLSELTGGKLKISTGMINGLSKQFSLKTEAEQKKAFADILLSPVMNTDFTSARVNGKNLNVLVCATPSTVIYFAREFKGHEGVKGAPVEDYRGTLVHDHDRTFYNYGDAHQECLDHVLRYLKGSMENEPDLKWNRQMRELIREMIHFRNGLDPGDDREQDQADPARVKKLEKRYDEILNLAKEEYEYEPPGKYYKDGFNLYKKMLKYRESHLLFLHDRRVPHTNSLSERLLRVFKRKQHQMMTFRCFDSLDNLCSSLGVIASHSAQGKNLYESVAYIFDIEKPRT